MTTESKNLLIKAYELQRQLPKQEPEEWKWWDHNEWAEQMELGPRYLIGRWFGPLRERDRMRYRRAIDVLEAEGLLTIGRCEGVRLTHLKLTPAGLKLAEQLLTLATTAATQLENE